MKEVTRRGVARDLAHRERHGRRRRPDEHEPQTAPEKAGGGPGKRPQKRRWDGARGGACQEAQLAEIPSDMEVGANGERRCPAGSRVIQNHITMAQSEKRENSVLFSLRELRQIEESRVQEEAHAQRSAEEARVQAIENEERARRDAEEARIRAIHDEEQRQRDAAEARIREERIRVQEAETQARIRAQAELEQQRLHNEMQLKMQEVAKTRPTWLLAIAGILTVSIIGLGVFFYKRHQEATAAEEANRQLAIEQEQSRKEIAQLTEDFSRLQNELTSLENELAAANNALNNAQTEADRKAARDRLAAAEARKVEAKAAIARKQSEMREAERKRKVTLSDDCKNNPLGC